MKKSLIIAVSAVSGGGKTTIIQELNKHLPLSKAIYFDDYDFEEYPKDFFEWVQRDADYNEWNLKSLVNDIKTLCAKGNVSYILLDYPFAYKNNQVAPYIDYNVFRMLRSIKPNSDLIVDGTLSTEKIMRNIIDHLEKLL